MAQIESYKEDGLIIQEKKTELRLYRDKIIYNENMKISPLDYLGFVVEKNIIRICERSLFKYYSRVYKSSNK